MNKNIDVTNQKPSVASKGQWKRIHELKSKIEKVESQITKLSKDKKTHFEKTQSMIAETEINFCKCLKGVIIELIRFIPYKSLSANRLDALLVWIDDLKNNITSNPFNVGENRVTLDDVIELQAKAIKARFEKFGVDPAVTLNPTLDLHSQINNLLKILQERLREGHEQELPLLSKAQWVALLTNPNLRDNLFSDPFLRPDPNYIDERNELGEFEFDMQELMSIVNALENEIHRQEQDAFFSNQGEQTDFDFEFRSDEENDFAQKSQENLHAEKLLDNKEINKLYRQLAHKFHPDKLADGDDKNHSIELMKQLASARKSKNFHIIIELAMNYLPQMSLTLSDKTLRLMEESLAKKLNECQQTLENQKYDMSVEGLVWTKFHARTQKQTEKNIEEHSLYLKRSIAELFHLFFAKPQTLKGINALLDGFIETKYSID